MKRSKASIRSTATTESEAPLDEAGSEEKMVIRLEDKIQFQSMQSTVHISIWLFLHLTANWSIKRLGFFKCVVESKKDIGSFAIEI